MKAPPAVIDTNVVVSGLITSDAESATCHILDGMIAGRFPYLLSTDLLTEYRKVMLRPKIRDRHGLCEAEIDALLTRIVANGILREPDPVEFQGKDPDDRHLWELVSAFPGGVLVTGDRALLENAPESVSVFGVASFLKLIE